MESSIGWLAQNILDTLLIPQLQAWIRRAGLAHDIEMLETEVEMVDMGYAAVRERLAGNRPLLARSLARLEDLLYQADDLVDELDYHRLLDRSPPAMGSSVGCNHTPIQSMLADLLVDSPSTDSSDNALGEQEDIFGAVQVHEKSRGDMDIVSSQVGKKRRLSAIWEHYELVGQDGNDCRVKCIHCGLELMVRHGSSRSHLRHHIKSAHCGNKKEAAEFSNDAHNAQREQEDIFGAVLVDKKSGGDTDIQSRQGGKTRSPVWEHFVISEADENNSPVKAKCIHCGSELNCGPKHGTSGLKRHIRSAGCTKKKEAADKPLNTSRYCT